MIEDGDTIPEPSAFATVMADRENRDGVAILVALKGAAIRAVRVNVTIPEDVLDRIDRFAAERGLNRSGFLTLAAKRTMDTEASKAAP
jgi:hypothetical protein